MIWKVTKTFKNSCENVLVIDVEVGIDLAVVVVVVVPVVVILVVGIDYIVVIRSHLVVIFTIILKVLLPPKSFIISNEIEIGVIQREIHLTFNIQHFVADVFYIMPAFFIFTQPICGHQEACRTEVTKKNNDVARRRTFSQVPVKRRLELF